MMLQFANLAMFTDKTCFAEFWKKILKSNVNK